MFWTKILFYFYNTHIISIGRCCDGGSAFEQKDDEHYDQVLWKDES